MTQDEIVKLAREAGLTDPDLGECVTDYGDATIGVLRFANLVAAAEREACAQTARTAMLGSEWVLTERVMKSIRARGEK